MADTIKDKENVDKIIKENDDLNNKANSIDLNIPNLPETKNIDMEFATYVKFITDENIQDNIQRNEDIIKIYAQESEEDRKNNEEGAKAYEEYITTIQDIKENFQERIQTISKQRVLGTCITGLAKYFDTSTVNKENFAEDFDIDTHN